MSLSYQLSLESPQLSLSMSGAYRLRYNIRFLISDCEDLKRIEAEIWLELRKYDGYKAKVNDGVLHWFEYVEKIQARVNNLANQERIYNIDEEEIHMVSCEVDLLQETASALLAEANHVRNLIDYLSRDCEDIKIKEAEIRLELRKHRGHRAKVDDNVLHWLENVEKIQDGVDDLTNQERKNDIELKEVYMLSCEINLLREIASSLLVSNARNGVERVVPGDMRSQPLVGKMAQEASKQIWAYLRDPTIRLIGLYGVGGVGKTYMMNNITNQLAGTDMFEKIIWVTLSKKPRLKKVQDDIAEQLSINLRDNDDVRVRASLLYDHLKSVETCLFILDDVWRTHRLCEIKIPEDRDGVKVVITTRFQGICTKMRVNEHINLVPLSANEAWGLFVSRSNCRIYDPEIQSVAKEIVEECLGLPLNIIAVSHAMRDQVDATAWRLALNQLRRSQREAPEEGMEHQFAVLQFCYNHLKSDRVRECFAYCALFPEDYKFESKELIGYWMAENFIDNKGDIITCINEGLEILKILIDAKMLEIYKEGDNECLIMHDLFRDLAISIVTEEFGFIAKAGLRIQFSEPIWERNAGRKISFIRNQIEHIGPIQQCPNLSSLLLKDNPLSQISPSFFDQMPNLEVLDMSYSGITDLPIALSKLFRLRALFLQYCTSLKKIPSLELLKKLQQLNLRGTLIRELPQGVAGLVSLRSLDLTDTIGLKYIEYGVISSLSNLEELRMQGSHLCKMESPITASCFKEIKSLKRLAILTLSAVGFDDHLETILYLQDLNLKIFSLNVYGSTQDYAEDV